MSEQYSIAEARHNLAALVRRLETQRSIEITRRGKPVALLLSLEEYRRITTERRGFWGAYESFAQDIDLPALAIEPEIFEGVRSREPGREADL